MTTWRVQATAAKAGERIKSIEIWSATSRTASSSHGYRIRAGIASGERVDWIGSWDQSTHNLPTQELLPLLASNAVGTKVPEGAQLVFEVTKTGNPDSIVGLSARFVLTKTGDGQTQGLFGAGSSESDLGVMALADQLNRLQLHEREAVADFSDPNTDTTSRRSVSDAEDNSLTIKVVSGSQASVGVSYTVTPESGRTAIGIVQGGITFESSNAAGVSTVTMGIHDGSTVQKSKLATSGNLGRFATVITAYPFEVTEETTFTLYASVASNSARMFKRDLVVDWTEQ